MHACEGSEEFFWHAGTPSPVDAAKTLVHALITTRVDYCNSVLYGITTTNLRPLQSVINAAARLITGKCKFDHITDTLRDDLHWLPVRQRIQFKLCSLVSKCQRRMAPTYLADMCIPVSATSGRTHLRSAVTGTSSFHGLAWPAMGLAVSPFRVH